MTTEYRVRAMEPRDWDDILALLKGSLGEGSIPRSREFWEWKHEENPFGRSPALVAESDGGIVGLRVFLRWGWQTGDHVVQAVRAVDTATHPDWRGRGIFSHLTRTLVSQVKSEGMRLVFNTPNDASRPGYLKMGWSSVGRIALDVLPRRPLRLVRSALSRRGEASSPASIEADLSPVSELLDEPGFREWIEHRDAHDDRLHTRRSMEYLRWRYSDIPGFNYFADSRREGDDGAAIIFHVRSRGGARELRICEAFMGSGLRSIGHARSLIRNVLRRVDADYAVAVSTPGAPERYAMRAAGFLPALRMGPALTVRVLDENLTAPDPLQRSSWRLAIGDLELF